MRYSAAGETNGHRVEMITRANIEDMVMPQVKNWIDSVGNRVPPEHGEFIGKIGTAAYVQCTTSATACPRDSTNTC